MIKKPSVLCISGHDPCGGAGIQADIEAINNTGAHAAPVLTCLTAQNTINVTQLYPIEEPLASFIKPLMADLDIKAIKIGLIGSVKKCEEIVALLTGTPDIPVVLDPVLKAGGGSALANRTLIDCIIDRLLPLVDIITPNHQEAQLLTKNTKNMTDCATYLIDRVNTAVLITGADNATDTVQHLMQTKTKTRHSEWSRLNGQFHGSGCTLAAAIASYLAQGCSAVDAITQAEQFTSQSLQNAYLIGQGQAIPGRLACIN